MSAVDDSARQAPIAGGKLLSLRRLGGRADQMTDAALVAACAVGDGAALGALFDRHSRAVYRFASRLAGVSSVDLDDLVSAAFLEACRSARAFRGVSSVRTWLFGIAANVVRHHVRHDRRRRALLDQYRQLPVAAAVERPDETAERRQLLLRLEAALHALPHDLRVAFVMCDVEDVACAEAARVLGLRQGTVWKRLQRARELLGSALR
jgi:RNA polymerase sigma-70 factor (ECF subfamily)